MRHYEIVANGCIPYFPDFERCPVYTMGRWPKALQMECNRLYIQKAHLPLNQQHVNVLVSLIQRLLKYMKEHLSTQATAQYICNTVQVPQPKSVLFLSGSTDPDYINGLNLHGFKALIGSACHDYPKVSYVYENCPNASSLYGKGITYTRIVPTHMREDTKDQTLVDDIMNHRYDFIVYASEHRGTPHYDLVTKYYPPEKIVMICGEDDHICNHDVYVQRGHHVFVREL